MTRKEREILRLLFARTWVSILDIASFFYPNVKYARRVMADLEKRGLVQSLRCPLFEHQGAGMNFYALTRAGLKGMHGQPPKAPTSTSLMHYFGINFFLTGFHVLQKDHPTLKVKGHTAKELLKAGYLECFTRSLDPPFPCVPDFSLEIILDHFRLLVIGEIDAATETISSAGTGPAIKQKFAFFTSKKAMEALHFLGTLYGAPFSECSYLHLTCGSKARFTSTMNAVKEHDPEHLVILVGSAEDMLPKHWEESVTPAFYQSLLKPVWFSHATPTALQRFFDPHVRIDS